MYSSCRQDLCLLKITSWTKGLTKILLQNALPSGYKEFPSRKRFRSYHWCIDTQWVLPIIKPSSAAGLKFKLHTITLNFKAISFWIPLLSILEQCWRHAISPSIPIEIQSFAMFLSCSTKLQAPFKAVQFSWLNCCCRCESIRQLCKFLTL